MNYRNKINLTLNWFSFLLSRVGRYGEFYNLLGAIPMIGQNGTSSEIFYKDDVTSLTKFCNDVGVKITSMWSINRDKPTAEGKIGSKNSLYLDTRLPNIKKYEFSDLLRNQRN